MKRYLILTVAVLTVLAVALGVYAQGERAGGAGEGRMRGFGRRNIEAQQEAVAAIEAQLAKLKKGLEEELPRPEGGFQDMSEEERNKFMEAMMKRREERAAAVAAIEQQVMILKGGRQLQAEHDDSIAELEAIHAIATKEEATETAKSIQALIDKRTKALEDSAEKLGIRLRRGRRMGQRQGPGEEQGRGQGQRQRGGQPGEE